MTAGRAALALATVLSGLSAGFFFAFEASVTPGLARVDAPTFVAAFRAINEAVRNPAFAAVFFGPPLAIVTALVLGSRAGRVRRMLLGGALALHLLLIAITAVGNVPLNERLAGRGAVAVVSEADARAGFETAWNRLNRIRTAAVVVGFCLLVLAAAMTEPQGRDDRR